LLRNWHRLVYGVDDHAVVVDAHVAGLLAQV